MKAEQALLLNEKQEKICEVKLLRYESNAAVVFEVKQDIPLESYLLLRTNCEVLKIHAIKKLHNVGVSTIQAIIEA